MSTHFNLFLSKSVKLSQFPSLALQHKFTSHFYRGSSSKFINFQRVNLRLSHSALIRQRFIGYRCESSVNGGSLKFDYPMNKKKFRLINRVLDWYSIFLGCVQEFTLQGGPLNKTRRRFKVTDQFHGI